VSAWKPGAVALVNDVTNPDAPWKAATCVSAARPGEREAEWVLHDTGGRVWGSVSAARPLVVIDPEDAEAVERLVSLMTTAEVMKGYSFADGVRDALREFANPTPPKPDEPRGLGAVVRDSKGYLYSRGYPDQADDFVHVWHVVDRAANKPRSWWKWDEIDAVEVLSEGVTL
jgi:hypothetical protein